MYILAIDTATRRGSVALLRDEIVLAETRLDLKITHAEKLLPAIAALLEKTGLPFDRLNGLALTIGPGSFTGLRIGLATMKGFAQAHQLPLIGISSLEALAYNGNKNRKPVAAILDAHRQEVYAAIYQFSNEKINKILMQEQSIKPTLLCDTLSQFDLSFLLGDGVVTYQKLFLEGLKGRMRIGEGEAMEIQASWVGRLALPRLENGEGKNWWQLTPNYLRPSDAEMKK